MVTIRRRVLFAAVDALSIARFKLTGGFEERVLDAELVVEELVGVVEGEDLLMRLLKSLIQVGYKDTVLNNLLSLLRD